MHRCTYRSTILLLAFPVILALTLSSCDKSDEVQVPPKIQLVLQQGLGSNDTLFGVGDLMTFSISAQKGSENITNLYAIKGAIRESGIRVLDTSMNVPTFDVHKTFVKGLEDTEYWTFVVRDKNRLTDSVSMIIYRDTTTDFGSIRFLESVELSAQDLNVPGSFFSFAEGIFDLNQALQHQQAIDLVYYFYGEDENVIASTGANIETGVFEGDLQDWDIRRTTRFVELEISPDDFYQAQNDSLLIVSYNEAGGKRKAKNLAAGKIFSFKTQDSQFGIFRVLDVVGAEAGTINVDIKIQDHQ